MFSAQPTVRQGSEGMHYNCGVYIIEGEEIARLTRSPRPTW